VKNRFQSLSFKFNLQRYTEVAIHSLQLYTMFRWHSGTAWFDDLSVNTLKEGRCTLNQVDP
jgi:hypothetical protein